MNVQAEQFYNQLRKAVETDQLKLPTLPDVALAIRKAVESESKSAEQIADILSQDPSLSARLLQLANSPLYRARCEIENLQMAVTRLGVKIVRDLVTTLAMRQLFRTESKVLERHFRELWSNSVRVAAVSRYLAAGQPNLDREHALLAGLIHNIGALPIVTMAQQKPELMNDRQALRALTQEIQHKAGKVILEFWRFPQNLIDVVSQCHDFNREGNGPVDYVDIVQVALLQSGCTEAPEDLSNVAAVRKLGLDSSFVVDNPIENQQDVNTTIQSLMTI